MVDMRDEFCGKVFMKYFLVSFFFPKVTYGWINVANTKYMNEEIFKSHSNLYTNLVCVFISP